MEYDPDQQHHKLFNSNNKIATLVNQIKTTLLYNNTM